MLYSDPLALLIMLLMLSHYYDCLTSLHIKSINAPLALEHDKLFTCLIEHYLIVYLQFAM